MSTKNYLPKGTNSTAFNPQLEHFDMICGQVMNENRILKGVCIGLGCFTVFLAAAIIIFEANRPATIPVLVTMNDFGETKYIGEVSRKNWQNFNVPEVAINYTVRQFVNCYHSLSTDRTVVKRGIENVYHLLTSTSASKYTQLMKEQKLYDDFGTFTREVGFETEPLKVSNDTYQLDYKVTVRNITGQIHKTTRYRAVITINTLTPTEEDIKDNPLGIYVTNFDIKELN